MLKTLALLLPNPSQAASLFRTGLQVLGTYLTTKGMIGGETWAVIVGPLLVLITTGYGSIYKRTVTNQVASTAKLPGVQQVIAVPDIAYAVPSIKVVPPAGG